MSDFEHKELWIPVQSTRFDLEAAKMEQLKRRLQGEMNAQIFLDGSGFHVTPRVTWRDRLRWRKNTVMHYLSTVWRALKGDDPYESDW